ncbi:MAG: NADH-quinone oxidoreductase subunit NuoH [Spirochaetes bacterium]|nr:NADH-quinone oxidoreductase subunit NuoH [Spirochaetota bacterium]
MWYQSDIFWVIVKIIILFGAMITGAAYYTLLERKWAGYIQDRFGPNRAGLWGILQPLADGIKFMTKQETIPKNADKWLFIFAPAISMTAAILLWAAIPFTPVFKQVPEFVRNATGQQDFVFQVMNPSGGLIYMTAIASLSVYGIMLAGWSSNNKYALLGAVRSTAQMISYELALALSLSVVMILAGSLDLVQIIKAQEQRWFIATVPGAIAFSIFLVTMFAETNRLPFDLAEAESELVVGFHTEYGAFKFALFFIAEYMNMITLSLLAALLFFGGYNIPAFIPDSVRAAWYAPLIGSAFFFFKAFLFVFLFVWVRWSIPRFRYDQLMNLGWKRLVPLAMANLFIAGLWVHFT